MHCVFTGLSGVPYKKRACDLRLLSLAQGLIATGDEVTILNRVPMITDQDRRDAGKLPERLVIHELFRDRPGGPGRAGLAPFLLASFFLEYLWLLRENRARPIDIIHVYTGHFIDILHYYLISRLIGAKLVYHYVELRSAKAQKGLYHWANARLVDRLGHRFFDGAIVISDFIAGHLERQADGLPTLKIPPVCDLAYFDAISSRVAAPARDYILFCGSAYYAEPIELIIESYKASTLLPHCKLYLVLSGSTEALHRVKKDLPESAVILSGLPYPDLLELYFGARALLIPVRNTPEDVARFPNKICEYAASRGVIVSTAYGEVARYFANDDNALIADDFSVSSYTRQLNRLLEIGPLESDRIRARAYRTCRESFAIEAYQDILHDFLLGVTRT